MKKFLSVLLMVAGLMSCGDDDKPFIPELNKLTSVTCTKNGNAFFNANITYDQDKQINRIILNTEGNQFTDNYIIVDKTISVSGVKMIDGSPTNPFVHTVYTLSGNMIAAKEEKSENKYMSNAVYTAVENRYTYSSNWLKSVSQIIQWPNEDGSGYQVRELGEVDRYSWENGNAVHYAYLPQKEITYEYNSQLRPENFPFRVVNSFQPVGFDVISPLNLLYGKMNQNLPTRAYWYNVSDATDICAEYTFRYTLTGDYITGMTIEEKINPYLRPLYDGLFDLLGAETFQKLFEKQVIEVAPLAYMRGRTLDDAFIILDEAQNTTPEQMKMFLTRMGVGSKVVVTGDVTQVDLPEKTRSGLVDALHILKGIDGIAQVYLTEKDVVRHRLVQQIVKAYERAAQPPKRAPQAKPETANA